MHIFTASVLVGFKNLGFTSTLQNKSKQQFYSHKMRAVYV